MTVIGAGVAASLLVVTGVLLARRPRHPVTVVLCVMTAATLVMGAVPPLLVDAVWGLAVLPLSCLLIAFPDGPRGRTWRRVFVLTAAAIGVACVLTLVPDSASGPVATPLHVVGLVTAILVIPTAGAAVVSLIRLWRRSTGDRRFRIGLVLAAGAVLVVPYLTLAPVSGISYVITGSVPAWARAFEVVDAAFLFTLVPLAVGVSMLLEPVGRRLRWLERIWPWALALSTALLVGGTSADIAVAAGAAAGGPVVLAVTCLAVAAGVAALSQLLRRRDLAPSTAHDRAALVLRELADRLRSVPEADAVPSLVTRVVGEAIEVRGVVLTVAVEGGREDRLAVWGEVAGEYRALPLRHGGEQVGTLVLVPHADGVALDLSLLDPLLPSLSATLAATALQQRLAVAHRHLHEVRAGERARLREDLHDELSPSLSGVRLTLHAVRAQIAAGAASHPRSSKPSDATALLQRADEELARATKVVHAILHDLRPDALTDGLVAAVRARAGDFHRPGTFQVVVTADDRLHPLRPSAEVAALRVASEAICNAARHCGGTRCCVSLTNEDDGILVVVADDGHGLPRPLVRGVGLDSMAHRATAAGGTFDITSDETGTVVRARFPADAGATARPAPERPAPAVMRAAS
jgi:signal transduction histidine kinase